jgi:hypothetical protein
MVRALRRMSEGDLPVEVQQVVDMTAVVVPGLLPGGQPLRKAVVTAVDACVGEVEVVHLDVRMQDVPGLFIDLGRLPEAQRDRHGRRRHD